MPVTRRPNRQLAAVKMVGQSEEEVFANLDKLDLNQKGALVLCGAQSKTWSMNRDHEQEQRQDRQFIDRLAMTDRTQVEDSDCEVPNVEILDTGVASVPRRPVHTSCPEGEVAGVSNHAVLAADVDHNFLAQSAML